MGTPAMNERHSQRDDHEAVELRPVPQGLRITVADRGDHREIRVEGPHQIFTPSGYRRVVTSCTPTLHSVETIQAAVDVSGSGVVEDFQRAENASYTNGAIKLILDFFDLDLPNSHVLDFGSGKGAFAVRLFHLGARRVTGVEVDPEKVELSRRFMADLTDDGFAFHRIDFLDGSNRLEFDDGAFDIVWANAVLEHVLPDERVHVLRECWRLTRPGGHFVISATPNRWWIQESHTTKLMFVNYLPLRLAHWLARRYARTVPADEPLETTLSRGFRGLSYWEVRRALPEAKWLALGSRYGRDTEAYIRAWSWPEDGRKKRILKRVVHRAVDLVGLFLRPFGVPQTAVGPSHVIVLQKPA
ncbi:MAG: class I SAM-dependent methyltransferase [Acetobacterales bacterium]